MKAKTCAILGSTPIDFPWGYDEEDERCHLMKLMLLQGISYCHYYESCKFDAMREAVNSANYVLAVLSKERTEPELAVLMHNAERQNLKTLVLYPGEK